MKRDRRNRSLYRLTLANLRVAYLDQYDREVLQELLITHKRHAVPRTDLAGQREP